MASTTPDTFSTAGKSLARRSGSTERSALLLGEGSYIDYKEVSRMRRFVSDRGKILRAA